MMETYFRSVPRFSEGDVEQERKTLTTEERCDIQQDLHPDKYSSTAEPLSTNYEQCGDNPHRVVTREEIDARIAQMRDVIHNNLSLEEKSAFMEAERLCQDEITNKRFELFLNRENMDPVKAANRLMAYWTERKRIFGPDKWYLPMTQAGALRDDGVALRKGYIRIVHSKDNSGRPIMLGTPRYHTRDGYDTQSMIRVVWYMYECFIDEYPEASMGAVWLSCNKNMVPNQNFDRKLVRTGIIFERDYFPFRFAAVHVCYSPGLYQDFVKPILFFVLGKYFRTRFIAHNGPADAQVLESLESYGIPADAIPAEMGGKVHLDHMSWLEKRAEAEQYRQRD